MRSPSIQDEIPNGIGGRTEGMNTRIARQSLNNYRAVKLLLFKNGDPWFGPINYHFLPGRDVTSLESLFKLLAPKMDLMNGEHIHNLPLDMMGYDKVNMKINIRSENYFTVRLNLFSGISYMFDSEGRRLTNIDQIMDGGVYICSSSKRFIPGNYGSFGDNFRVPESVERSPSPMGTTNLFRSKKNSAPLSAGSDEYFFKDNNKAFINGGARSGRKPGTGDGKVIGIINADQQHIKERVLLNLKTTQPFEDVLRDLGQVCDWHDFFFGTLSTFFRSTL